MLIFRVGKSSGFIQHYDGSVFQNGPRQSDSLLLAAGQINAFCSHHSIQPLRQLSQNVVALGGMGGSHDLFSGSRRSGSPDIFHKAFFKQPGILKDKSHLIHQIFCVHLPDIDSADRDGSAVCIPEAGNQACGCGLAAAGRPYQRHYLAGPDSEGYVVKSRAVRAGIGKGHMVKRYGGVRRTFLYFRFFHRLLAEDFIQAPHSFVRFHDSLAHVHDPVDHLPAGRSKQGVEDKINQYCPDIPAGGQQKSGRNQQDECPVDTSQETGLPHTAAHGILACQIAVILYGGVKGLE